MKDIDTSLAEEAVRIVTGSRQAAYDHPERNFTRIARAWEALTDRPYTAREVGLMMAAMKLVRESHRPQRDNIVDGIGYLLCADASEPEPCETCNTEVQCSHYYGQRRCQLLSGHLPNPHLFSDDEAMFLSAAAEGR